MGVYIDSKDVMRIMGCARSTAYQIIAFVNEHAEKKNLVPFPRGKANKYIFAELYGIPKDDIDNVIEGR